MAYTGIKRYYSTMTGAPVLKGQQSGLIDVLDGLCVGFGAITVASITRSGATVTVDSTGDHNFSTDDIVVVGGCAETEYNGEFRITVIDSASFSYTVSGTPDSPATGSPTCKRAGIGFTKVFSGTHKAVYRCDDGASTRMYLRVLDDASSGNGAKEAVLTAYESMSDVDTGTTLWATRYLWKSSASDASARGWAAFSDGQLFYLFISPESSYVGGGNNQPALVFGDFIPSRANDPYRCVLGAQVVSNCSGNTYIDLWNASSTYSTAASYYMVAPRAWTGLPGACSMSVHFNFGGDYCFGYSSPIAYPHAPDNGFYMSPCLLVSGNPAAHIRGIMPGLYEPMHGHTHGSGNWITDVQNYAGRSFFTVHAYNYYYNGTALIDATGPWR